MAVEECVDVGNNSPVEEGGDSVLNNALLTQPRNNIRDDGEDTSTPAMEFINWTILFNSDNKDNSSPSATMRFSGYYEMDPRDVEHNCIESSYIDRLYNSSDLIIANPKAAAKAFQKKGPLGLLHLFIPPNFIESYMLNATQELLNEKEASRGKKIKLTITKLHCVLGLDIAMSLWNSTTMKELWSKKMFLGSLSFSESMSRDEFITICGSLCIHSKTCSKDPHDPHWTCRPLLSSLI